MKHIINSTLLLLFLQMQASAQMMQNGDFGVNNGNTRIEATCGGRLVAGIIINQVQNWQYSFGTPHFEYRIPFSPCLSGPPSCNFPDAIYLGSNSVVGEGITGHYSFQAGRTYNIYIGFSRLPKPGNFEIWVTPGPGPVINTNQCYGVCTDPSGTHGQAPNLPAAGAHAIWRSSGTHTPAMIPNNPTTPLKLGNNIFTYTPTSNWEWIQLYPWHDGCYVDDVLIDYVWIYPDCIDDLYLNHAPGNYYAGYSNIWIGSQYGTGLSLTSINGNKNFEAGKQITLNSNLLITATKGTSNYYIDKNTCGEYPRHIHYSDPGIAADPAKDRDPAIAAHGMMYSQSTAEHELPAPNSIQIYPNPAADKVSLRTDLQGKLDIQIQDAYGKTVLQETTEHNGTQEYTLTTSQIPNGIYYLKVTGEKGLFTQKLIILR